MRPGGLLRLHHVCLLHMHSNQIMLKVLCAEDAGVSRSADKEGCDRHAHMQQEEGCDRHVHMQQHRAHLQQAGGVAHLANAAKIKVVHNCLPVLHTCAAINAHACPTAAGAPEALVRKRP